MPNLKSDRLKPAPRRAEPLQPDKPGGGTERVEQTGKTSDQVSKKSASKQKQQSDSALDNVKTGYD